MRVINVLIAGSFDLFLELLIRELIKNEIGYVQVDEYEFHMMDNIYRFYPAEEKELVGVPLEFNFLSDSMHSFIANGDMDAIEESITDLGMFDYKEKMKVNNFNKEYIKCENINVNRQLRANQRQYVYSKRKKF